MPPMPMRWWLRPVSIAARVGEHTAVTWKALYVTPIACTRVSVGVLIPPPNVSGPPKPASSMSTSSTFGASCGADGPGMKDQSAADSAMVRPMTPLNRRSGIGSTVRSGTNFCAASASESLRPRTPFLSIGATDLAGVVMTDSAARRSSLSIIAISMAWPDLSFSPRPVSMPLSTLCLASLQSRPPPAAPTTVVASSGGAASPTSRPTPPPQPRPLRPRWSPVCWTVTLPSASLSTRITPSVRTFFSFASPMSASKSFWAAAIAG